MHKRKIIHLITGLDHGGAEMMLVKLLCAMDSMSFDNIVVSMTTPGLLGEQIRQLEFPLYSLGLRRGGATVAGLMKWAALLLRHSPDIVQTWLYHSDLLGLIGSKMLGVPSVIWNIRSTYIPDNSGFSTRCTRSLCASMSRIPNAIVVNSERGRAFHTSIGYRPRHWAVIPNGFDLHRFAPDAEARLSVRHELGLAPATVLVGLIARYDPLKDHANFLQAAGLLRQRHPQVHFLLAGAGVAAANQTLANLIAEHRLDGHIHLLGPRRDIPRLTASLDIASCSSIEEGFPNAIGEAMACGVPCVVTHAGDSAAIVGHTGIAVPSRNARSLADGWMDLIDRGEHHRQELGAAARIRIRQHYSMRAIADRYQALYASQSRFRRNA